MFSQVRQSLVNVRADLAAANLCTIALHRQHETPPGWAALRTLIASQKPAANLSPELLAPTCASAELSTYAASLAPRLADLLARRVQELGRRDALLELATEQIANTLETLNVRGRVALLKGSATGRLVYAQTAHRQRRDLDLLIQPNDFHEIRAALWNTGWRDAPLRESGGAPFTGRTFGMRLALGAASVSLDLHRDLVSSRWCGLTGRTFRDAFLERALPQDASLPVTDLTDTFIHTVAHIVHSGFLTPLKVFVDLLLLWPRLDASTLLERVAQYRLRTATWACLGVLERWFDVEADAIRRVIQPNAARRQLLDRLLTSSGPYAVPSDTPRWRAVRGFPRLLVD